MVLEGAAAHLAAARPGPGTQVTGGGVPSDGASPRLPPFRRGRRALHRRIAEVGGNRLLVVILTALRDPIVRLITAGLSGETEAQARAKILRTHGEILKAIRARDSAAADRRSRRHLFDLYSSLVAPKSDRAWSRCSADPRVAAQGSGQGGRLIRGQPKRHSTQTY